MGSFQIGDMFLMRAAIFNLYRPDVEIPPPRSLKTIIPAPFRLRKYVGGRIIRFEPTELLLLEGFFY
jgi:hypothetical protein